MGRLGALQRAGGRFTGPFHYIDARDSPPSYCGIDFARDCGGGGACVVTALDNYTARVLDARLPAWERNQAARFVVHFVGDVHQPLHTEDAARGGNGIAVRFDGVELNLHHVWDTSIPEKMVGGRVRRRPFAAAEDWAARLTAEIRWGKFHTAAADWHRGMDIADPLATAMVWARESNAYVCSHGMPAPPCRPP